MLNGIREEGDRTVRMRVRDGASISRSHMAGFSSPVHHGQESAALDVFQKEVIQVHDLGQKSLLSQDRSEGQHTELRSRSRDSVGGQLQVDEIGHREGRDENRRTSGFRPDSWLHRGAPLRRRSGLTQIRVCHYSTQL